MPHAILKYTGLYPDIHKTLLYLGMPIERSQKNYKGCFYSIGHSLAKANYHPFYYFSNQIRLIDFYQKAFCFKTEVKSDFEWIFIEAVKATCRDLTHSSCTEKNTENNSAGWLNSALLEQP